MSRPIDADALAQRLEASPLFNNFGEAGIFIKDFVLELIQNQPTAKNEVRKAIDDFAERLKKYYNSFNGHTHTAVVAYHIDQIATEQKEKC